MKIDGHVFIVSGAASGLGAETARALVGAGGKVMLADLDAEAGRRLAETLGGAARFIRTDVTDQASAGEVVDAASSMYGGLHGLVNCAGIAPAARVIGRAGPHPLGDFARTIEVNLVGSFNMARLAAARMAEAPAGDDGERGIIINTASIAAFEGQVGQAAYAASKAGVIGLTLPMARELARFGIRVMTIAPGVMETPMITAMPEAVRTSLAAMVPFPPRLGRPAEFAALVLHVIENVYLNGEVIRLDGGIRMGAGQEAQGRPE